jgi:hypothetical protein
MMPASFLARHRTICEVLTEIKTIAAQTDEPADGRIIELCDEAIDYAQRMSAKLTEYKAERSAARSESGFHSSAFDSAMKKRRIARRSLKQEGGG